MNCIVNYSDSSDEEENINTRRPLKRDGASLTTGTGQSNKFNNNSTEGMKTYESNERESEKKLPLAYCRDRGTGIPHKKLKISSEESKHDIQCPTLQDGKSKEPLRLPNAIQSMFSSKSYRQWTDDPSQHGDRIRTFPHVEGNWATHVFIPVQKDERLICFVKQLLALFEPLTFEMLPEFHISLSRTVVIRHHWIDPLVQCLKDKLTSSKSCVGDLDDIKFYSNDEKTRTFLCLEVSKEDTAFEDYVSSVDKCFSEFKLQKYYENPSFHISVAWCLGNVSESMSMKKVDKAKEMLGDFCAANPELSVVFARSVCFRSGNKSFLIPLIV